MSTKLNQSIISDINKGTNIEAFLIWQWLINSQQFSDGNIDPAEILNHAKEKLLEATASAEAAAWISHINFTRKISRKFGEIAMYDRELTSAESSVEAITMYPDNEFKIDHLKTIQASLTKQHGATATQEAVDDYIQKTSEKLSMLKKQINTRAHKNNA